MKNKEIKFETLKKSHKKYIIGGVIAVCIIGSALTFRLTHSKYRVTQSIDLGSGVINYKVPDFKIMAMYQQKDGSTCTDDSCYNELTGRMPSSGYVINESKSYCTLDNVNHDNEAKLYTYEGKHVFENLKKSDKCYLYFDKIPPITIDNIIASVNAKTTKPDFNKVATTDEGVYATADGTNMYSGTTYYWRGAVENNHVIFAGYCWRIIRINGDKTIRLIYNGGVLNNNTCFGNGDNINSRGLLSQAYNSSTIQSNYVGWTYSGTSQRGISGSSNAKTQLESWYNSHIGNNATYSAKVADGKYCNDREISNGTWSINGSAFYYAAYGRLTTNNSPTPTFNCTNSSDVYTLKIGLITADEVAFAGGKNYVSDNSSNNTSYYLYNGNNFWTMSPSHWNGGNANVFTVRTNGILSTSIAVDTTSASSDTYPRQYLCIRPVINLKSDTQFNSGGQGTANSPYVVA